MPFRQNVVVAATFLDFQANIFPLLFKPSASALPMITNRKKPTAFSSLK
jgi:hypothetical protein